MEISNRVTTVVIVAGTEMIEPFTDRQCQGRAVHQ